jgi:methylated-DNA-protein-cysteine methyltransferase related protein
MKKKKSEKKELKSKHNFFEDVYDVVRLIPKGRVTNYGSIAAYLGSKLSSRMVGWAMNAAHGDRSIPAHRVVNRMGLLTGKHHFNPPESMQKKLEQEGLKIVKDKIQNYSEVYWDPSKELI